MRTDIYSFNDGTNDFLVELHSSSSIKKKLGKDLEGKSKEKIQSIVRSLASENPSKTESEGIQRVIVDKDWKKIQIVDKHGRRITRTIADIVGPKTTPTTPKQAPASLQAEALQKSLLESSPKAPEGSKVEDEQKEASKESPEERKEEAQNPTSATVEKPSEQPVEVAKTQEPILLASTDKDASKQYVKGGFIERGFNPVTTMEKIWKFFNNISQFITGVAAKQGRSLGSYDFATHFFSKGDSLRQLQTEELKSSVMLTRLADFFKDNDVLPEDIANVEQAASWAKKIEDLRDKTRSSITSGYEGIARDMQAAVAKLEPGSSLLIPFSTYEGELGERMGSLRLLALTLAQEPDAAGKKQYILEFVDSSESPPIRNIPESKLSLDDFFKPLVDIQLSASFTQEPASFMEKVVEAIGRFGIQHPKLTAWALMGKSPKEERFAVAAMMQHAQATGLLNPNSLADEKTHLTAADLAKHIFGPLIVDETEVRESLLQPKPQLQSAQRTIDGFLPLVPKELQAKVEATSLFQFYYLYQACLDEDTATLAIMESGLNRVCELYERLNIVDTDTTEMLRVIRTHITRAKQQINSRTINTNETLKSPVMPESYAMNIPGRIYDVNAAGKQQLPQEDATATFERLVPLAPEAVKDILQKEAENAVPLAKADKLEIAIARVVAQKELLAELAPAHKQAAEHYRTNTLENLKILQNALRHAHSSITMDKDVAKGLADGIDNLLKSLKSPDLNKTQLSALVKEYQTIVKGIDAALKKVSEQSDKELTEGLQRDVGQITAIMQGTIDKQQAQQNKLRQDIIDRLRELENTVPAYAQADLRDAIDQISRNPAADPFDVLFTKPTKCGLSQSNWAGDIDDYDLRQLKRDYNTARDNVSTLARRLENVRSAIDSKTPKECVDQYWILNEYCPSVPSVAKRTKFINKYGDFLNSTNRFKDLVSDYYEALFTDTPNSISQNVSGVVTRVENELSSMHAAGGISDSELEESKKLLDNLTKQSTLFESFQTPSAYADALKTLQNTLTPIIAKLTEARERLIGQVQNTDLSVFKERLQPRTDACYDRYFSLKGEEKQRELEKTIDIIDPKHTIIPKNPKGSQVLPLLVKKIVIGETIDELVKFIKSEIPEHASLADEDLKNQLTYFRNDVEMWHKQHQDPISEADQYLLRHELAALLAELPITNLDKSAGLWAKQTSWKENILVIRALLEKAYPEETRALPEYVLQKTLCLALLGKISDSGLYTTPLLESKPALQNNYLRFNTPLQQKQQLAVDATIAAMEAKEKHKVTGAEKEFNFVGRAVTDVEFYRGNNPKVPFLSLTTTHKEVQGRQVHFEQNYDQESCGLLNRYLNYKVDENDSESSIRINTTEKYGVLSADDCYKLFSTNSADPQIGLEQLLLQVTSPGMRPFLNDTTDGLGVALARLLENRMLRPGHLEAFFNDPNHEASVVAALNSAIDDTSRDYPTAHLTLLRAKATILIFLKEQHRFDANDAKFQEYSRSLEQLLAAIDGRIATNDAGFKDVKLQLHTTRLKLYAQSFAADPTLKALSQQDLASLLSSWFIYQNAVSVGYTDKQEEAAIQGLFSGQMLPVWNKLSDAEKKETLSQVLVAREKAATAEVISWNNTGELYSATLATGALCQIGLLSGSFTINGIEVPISGDGLPEDLWKQFPLMQAGFKPIDPAKVPDTGNSEVYEFRVDGLAGQLFQVERNEDGVVCFSVKKTIDGKESWFQHSPLKSMEQVRKQQLELKKAKEEEEKEAPDEKSVFAFIKAVVAMITQPIQDLKDQAQAAGAELGKKMLPQSEELTVPKDIVESGVWVNKSKNTQGIILNKSGDTIGQLSLSHSKKSVGDGPSISVTKFTAVKRGELNLVNNPKSSVYTHLSGLTKKENIKIWADSKGVMQKIELLDPKMTFERDPKTNRMMSNEVTGFYISDDQSMPVADFGQNWKNYLVLTNDDGDRRLVMRQSAILAKSVLTEKGFEHTLSLILERETAPIEPSFIDVELVEHPEKGYVLRSNKSQANFYLGLAALQGLDFPAALGYIRAAARSAPYDGKELALINEFFAYKNSSFSLPPPPNAESKTFEHLVTLADAMHVYDPLTPNIAAAKLAALACVLEQDLSKQPELKAMLPKAKTGDEDEGGLTIKDVERWLTIYNMPSVEGTPFHTTQEGCQLTADELYRILLHYPSLAQGAMAEKATMLGVELIGKPAETTLITPMPKPTEVEIAKIESYLPDSPLAEQLAQTRQTKTAEQSLTFQAGTYIIRHFKELYKQLNKLDGKLPEHRVKIEELLAQLNRYKDVDPGKKEAIEFLRNIALQKFHDQIPPGKIKLDAARKGFSDHMKKLDEHRNAARANYQSIIDTIGHEKRDRLDFMSESDFNELEDLIKKLKALSFETDASKMEISAIQETSKTKQNELHLLVSKLSSKIRSLATAQRVTVRGELEEIEERAYRTYKEMSLSPKEVLALGKWCDDGCKAPGPSCLSKIKIHSAYSLQDHLKNPAAFELPEGKSINVVLEKFGVVARYRDIIRNQEQIESAQPYKENAQMIADLKEEINKPLELVPLFERTQWSESEIRVINTAIRSLEYETKWTQRVHTPVSFPALSRDKFNEERMAAFLTSHAGERTYPLPEKPVESEDIEETAPAQDYAEQIEHEVLPFTDPSNAKEAYAKARDAILTKNAVAAYFIKENIPFFDKLSDLQLFEFDRTIRHVSPETPAAVEALFMLISNPEFHKHRNAYELARQFLDKTSKISEPQNIKAESQRMRDNIEQKEARKTEKTAPKGTVALVADGTSILADTAKITAASNTADLTKVLTAIQTSEKTKNEEVKALRLSIIEKANKLPDNPAAKNAEELRRLRGAAVIIDAEMVFHAYAKDDLESLKRLNPSLVDADIALITDLVTAHHIQATALQTVQKQLENIETAVRLRTRFDELSTQSALAPIFTKLNDAASSFLTTNDSTRAKALIDELIDTAAWPEGASCPEGYTPQGLADDIRDFMAVLESCNKNGATKRFYNPQHNHAHTRAALAYEYTLGVVFRKDQIDEFTRRVATPDIVSWLGTGFGKTFMAPGLAKMMATGTNLVCVVDTKDLIPTTSKTRDQDSRAVYGQAAFQFQFARKPAPTVEDLEMLEYRLLKCIDNEEYLVTSKEALGSLVLQLLSWQRQSVESGQFDNEIAVAQRIVSIFRERAVALGDEIHLILNVIEALDYAEGSEVKLSNYSEYYETTSSIYRCIYPQSDRSRDDPYVQRSQKIASMLKITENRQAQVNQATVREAMGLIAELIIDQSLDPEFKPKDKIHVVIQDLITKKNLSKEVLVQLLTISETGLTECPKAVLDLDIQSKRHIATLKESLSNTFEKTLKKIADDDFGVNTDDKLSICPYNKGRAQPSKEFDDIFQTIQTHYMWYGINGIPVEGLIKQIHEWNAKIESELIQFEEIEFCPSYVTYRTIFGASAPSIRDLTATNIEALAKEAKNKPEVLYKFLELVVLPARGIFPKKLGFNSMDLVSMVHKFGGYAGTIQTRSSFQRGVSNKDDPNVDKRAAENFRSVYENPNNQDQYSLPDLDSPAMKQEARKHGTTVAPLSVQLNAANVNIKDFRAIIDIGGLFKEIDYKDMAQDILSQFDPSEMQAVLIYNDKSELMILRRGSQRLEPFEPKATPPDPEMRFTVYRQPQITGSDIPQALRAKALVTINEKTGWGEFEQGVGRLRKNKEGQTYAVIYRDSLVSKLNEDVAIATKKKLPEEEINRLKSLYKDNKIDVKSLTGHSEQEEIKQRRYFAALSEMENIVKQPIRDLLCGEHWREIFAIFEDRFFEESLKSPDQLLAIKQPTKPMEILERQRKTLSEGLTKALSLDEIRGNVAAVEALKNALKDLGEYKLPDSLEMPETVVGTASDSTRETEVARETEVTAETEKQTEVTTESINLQDTIISEASSAVDKNWIKWTPTNVTSLLSGQRLGDDTAKLSFNLAEDCPKLLEHLRGYVKAGDRLAVDYAKLFAGLSTTANMVQHRKESKNYYTTKPASDSLLSEGQKICRSLAEISVEGPGSKRKYHALMLDVRDQKVLHASIFRAATLLTPALKEAIAALIKNTPNATLGSLKTNPEFQKLFAGTNNESQANMDFFVNFLGNKFLAKDVASVAIRINTEGKYTAACGALTINDSDNDAQELIMRSKIIRGEPAFTVTERRMLKRLLSEEYLGLANFDELKDQQRAAGKTEREIEEFISQKQTQGIKDYKELSQKERIALEKTLLEVFKLYATALKQNQAHTHIDVNNTHFGVVVRDIVHNLRKRVE